MLSIAAVTVASVAEPSWMALCCSYILLVESVSLRAAMTAIT